MLKFFATARMTSLTNSAEVSTAEVLVDDMTNVPLQSEIEISKEGMVTTPTDEAEWKAVESDSTNE